MTYREACAQACEGCRADWIVVSHTHWGPGGELLECIAPTRDEHEIVLLARIAELEADRRRLDWLQQNWQHIWGVKFIWRANPLTNIRAAIDVAMKDSE